MCKKQYDQTAQQEELRRFFLRSSQTELKMNSKSSPHTVVGASTHADAPYPHQAKTLEAQPWVRLDFSRAKWYTLMYRYGAPKPIKFGRSARWIPSEVDAWVNQVLKNGGAV